MRYLNLEVFHPLDFLLTTKYDIIMQLNDDFMEAICLLLKKN